MEPFQTDQGTLQLLGRLDVSAARRLAAFLETCDALRANNPSASETFRSIDFVGRDDVVEMKLERRMGADRKILATVKLANGALWRRGQLRIPGIELPEAVRSSVAGRAIEEIVDNPPFRGFTVTGAVQDGSGGAGHLRLRCTAERVGDIVVDVDGAPRHDLGDLERMAAAHAGVPVDPVAAHVLATRMDRRDALLAILQLAEAKPGVAIDLPVEYSDMVEPDAPKEFEGVGKHGNPTYHRDTIQMKRTRAGYQVTAHAVGTDRSRGSALVAIIENGMVHRHEPEGDEVAAPSSLEALGFTVPGIAFGTKPKHVYGGLRSRDLLPVRTVGEAMQVG